MTKRMKVVVVGSVALDSVETPKGRRKKMQGGSASYASLASALFAPTGLVGVVGKDFPKAYMKVYRAAALDLTGLQQVEGKTFHWDGTYEANMNNRRTNRTELNVFADFKPILPAAYGRVPYLCLGNISPDLQALVLSQMKGRPFIMLDTMEMWIENSRKKLMSVISKVDLLTVNEHEARALTGEESLFAAARAILKMGPKYALVKKGEHGALVMSRNRRDPFLVPAWPLEDVVDPTGAGDSFAGALAGALAEHGDRVTWESMCEAMVTATAVASCTCGAFGIDGLAGLKRRALLARVNRFRKMLP